MALADIFNPTFFLVLGIVLLLMGLLVIYYETKFRDQNHKISSMVSLVSAMAEELNVVRGRIQMTFGTQPFIPLNPISNFTPMNSINMNLDKSLIDVSDNEDDDDEDEDGDDEEDDDEDEETDDEEEETDDEDDDDKSEKTSFNKIFQLSENEVININENDTKILNFNGINELEDLENMGDEFDDELDDDLDELTNIENDLEEINNLNLENTDNDNNTDFLKTIHISSNLEDEESKKINNFDYKKMSLNALRNVVVEKGFVTDSSKMKKTEMLKLLGIE